MRNLKNKIYECMTAVSKNVYIDKWDEIVDKYSNTYHVTIRMKPVDIKLGTYTDCGVEHNDKDPKFKFGDHMRISKYKNIFLKGCNSNWSEKVFVMKSKKYCTMDICY